MTTLLKGPSYSFCPHYPFGQPTAGCAECQRELPQRAVSYVTAVEGGTVTLDVENPCTWHDRERKRYERHLEDKWRVKQVTDRMMRRLEELDAQVIAGTYNSPTGFDLITSDRPYRGITDDQEPHSPRDGSDRL